MSTYYDYLYSIEDNEGHVSPDHVIAFDTVPFPKARDAVRFVIDHCPDVQPEDKPLRHSEEDCRRLTRNAVHEVNYLCALLEEELDKAKRESEKHRRLMDACGDEPRDLLDQVHYEVAKNYYENALHEEVGISRALTVLRQRRYELETMGKYYIPNERRI